MYLQHHAHYVIASSVLDSVLIRVPYLCICAATDFDSRMHRSGVYKQVTRNSQKRRGSTQRRLFVGVYQVCNNLGQCHCEVGYAPPQCDRPGNGGSQHSGPVSVLHGLSGFSLSLSLSLSHTHTHSVLTAIFPGEPGLAGCPLNSPFPFIPGLRILLGQTKTFPMLTFPQKFPLQGGR